MGKDLRLERCRAIAASFRPTTTGPLPATIRPLRPYPVYKRSLDPAGRSGRWSSRLWGVFRRARRCGSTPRPWGRAGGSCARCRRPAGGGAPAHPQDPTQLRRGGMLRRRGGDDLGQAPDMAAGRRGDDGAPNWPGVAGGLVLSGGSIVRQLIVLRNHGQRQSAAKSRQSIHPAHALRRAIAISTASRPTRRRWRPGSAR